MPTHLGTPSNHPTTELHTYHENPRQGDVTTIANSLRTNGQFRPIVVNKGTHTGRPNEVLAGNHTLKAARQLTEEGVQGFDTLDCYIIDVDDDSARRIVLADNRTADLGSYDDNLLLDVLEAMDGDYTGTGYMEEDVDMLRDIVDAAPSLDELAEEFGDPEADDYNVTLRFSLMPHIAEQWAEWAKPYDTDEEAFEALLDKSSNYTSPAPGAEL